MLSCAQEESYTAEDPGTFELPDREQSGRPADVLERLEAATEDRRRGLEGAERISELLKDAEAKFSDDYTMNKALRRRLRCAKNRALRPRLLYAFAPVFKLLYHFLRVCWTATVYVKVCQRRRCEVAVNATRAAVFRRTACVIRCEGMLFMPSMLFAPGTNTVPWAY